MNPQSKVVITDWTFPNLETEEGILRLAGVKLVARQCRDESDLIALVADADAIITQFARLNAAVIAAMSRARAIVRYGVGVDNIDLEAARMRGIPVCNIPDYCVDEVADHTLAFILALTRQVLPNAQHLREGHWGLPVPVESMCSLRSLTVGVIGFGRIGREVVRRLLAFKARVLVFDPVIPPSEIARIGAEAVASLSELLPQCDLITPHCPVTPQTTKLFDVDAFARMKRGALFVNVGRGQLADSGALVAALQSGQLSAAALDVFDPEPIPSEHPIRRMPNVILAPHVASVSAVAVQTLRKSAADLAVRALRNEPLPHIVNRVTPKSTA